MQLGRPPAAAVVVECMATGLRTGTIALVGKRGSPAVMPIWASEKRLPFGCDPLDDVYSTRLVGIQGVSD